MIRSYPPYHGASQAPSPLVPPGFLGFLPHPGNRAPPLPERPALPALPAGWVRSYHAAPAAYPRQVKESHGTNSRESEPFGGAPATETKKERSERILKSVDKLVQTRFYATEWTLEEAQRAAPPGQFLAVERWRRAIPRGGFTLVCTHANGTLKEHWHPVLLDMLARDPIGPGYAFGTGRPLDQSNVVIDDVWFIDELSHSVSADLNAGFLGTAEIWTDVARDIVNFIVHVLPSADVRYQLDWAPAGVTKRVYGLGASFGGAAQLIAAAYRPELFEGVMLVDGMTAPRVNSLGDYLTNGLGPFFRTGDALKRRDRWPSRQAARQALSQALFFQKWDPAMFDLYISHGLVPVDNDRPDRAVRLATAPWSEAIIFCEPFEAARGWDLLPKVQVPVGFLMAADPERTMGESITREVVWRPPLSRNERSRTAEHLIIQQNPREVADSAWRFLQTMSAGWGTREQILDDYQIAKL